MISLLIFMLFVQITLSAWLMWRSPFNTVSIVGSLTTIFGSLPPILYNLGTQLEFYSWRTFSFLNLLDSRATHAAILLACINIPFLAGACVAEGFYKRSLQISAGRTPQPMHTAPGMIGRRPLMIVSWTYTFIWLLSAYLLFQESGQSISEFLLPIKKTGIAEEQSGYLRSIYLMMPVVLATIHYWRQGRFNRGVAAWIALAAVATFSTHQRRSLITTVLFVVGLSVFLYRIREDARISARRLISIVQERQRKLRIVALLALPAALMLVPILWYARVYFTASTNSSATLDDVLQIRSVTDIIFGSPAVGFPALVLIMEYVDLYSTNLPYIILYPLTIFIPRSIWASKPIDLDTTLQARYLLLENPSSYWFGELYYSFGYFVILVAPLFAYYLYRTFQRCLHSSSIWARTVCALLFMQSITLYKNGVTVFTINLLVMGFFLIIAKTSCYRVKQR